MSVAVEFFGGLRVIGSSKIMISTERARVLLDMGLDIPGEPDLFRPPVAERTAYRLRDRLAVGAAPPMPGLYDPDQLAPGSPLAAPDRRPTAIFLSHAHLDHDGALAFARPEIPLHAHPDTVAIEAAAAVAGTGAELDLTAMTAPVAVGDLRVEALPVDHDVPGACGFLVHTPDGTLAYTGDLNFHRDGGLRSAEFVRAVAGTTMLVTETTTLSFDPPPGAAPYEPRSESAVLQVVAQALDAAPGIALLSAYERDVERAQRLIDVVRGRGRTLVWPGQQATLLHHVGLRGVATWDASRPQRPVHLEAVRRLGAAADLRRVSLAAVEATPSAFVVQPDVDDTPALLDLPRDGGFQPFVHSQGEPLGPFMANWAGWIEWLAQLGFTFVAAGSSGHATGAALHKMVMDVHPGVVVPIHGFRPEALVVDVPTLLPEYGVRYALDGTPLPV
ncbi:MBL fold metallo-hydrolase [Pseudonocardia sp. GCM10023141]|uniref:MBL fold metallo-hydrolase n=1 Tax=Pseudonocardia sp. GCM10023141 TaxID=3252653 RepID=UPI003611808F